MSRLTEVELAAIRARYEEASSLPSLPHYRAHVLSAADVPRLLAEVDALRAELAKAQALADWQGSVTKAYQERQDPLVKERDAAITRAENAEAERDELGKGFDDARADAEAALGDKP